MLFSNKDIELLKIACWCKNIPSPTNSAFKYFCRFSEIEDLLIHKFLSIGRDKNNIRARSLSCELLSFIGLDFKPDQKQQTKATLINRRLISAEVLITFYLSGIPVFNSGIEDFIDTPVYIPSFAVRSESKGNPFANARFRGIFCDNETAYIVYYVDDIGVHFQNELRIINNYLKIASFTKTVLIFMSKTVAKIHSTVTSAKKQEIIAANMDSFKDIFLNTHLDIHFIPTSDLGALMLKIMLIDGYRKIVTKTIMKNDYRPPYENQPDTDTIHHDNQPAILAIDMNIKRLDRAMSKIHSDGFERLHIYALEEQIPYLKHRYVDKGMATLYKINMEKMINDINYSLNLNIPQELPYITEEGRFISAEDFKNYRKTREQN